MNVSTVRYQGRHTGTMKKLAGWLNRLASAVARENYPEAQVCIDAMRPLGLSVRFLDKAEAEAHREAR